MSHWVTEWMSHWESLMSESEWPSHNYLPGWPLFQQAATLTLAVMFEWKIITRNLGKFKDC